MNNQNKQKPNYIRIIGAALVVAVWIGIVAAAWFGEPQEVSASERRPLAQMPELTVESIEDRTFMDKFNSYSLDQFPLRDRFRSAKAIFHSYVMQYAENNGLYVEDGYIVKQEVPLNMASVDKAVSRFQFVYDRHVKDKAANVYVAVVPDKNYYAAGQSGHLQMDYKAMFQAVEAGMPWAEYIDITDCLSLEDYYRTDTHWRQEQLIPVAQKLTTAMGVTAPKAEDFTVETLDKPFYGVYYGQAALPMEPDAIQFLHSKELDSYVLYDMNTGRAVKKDIYDMTQLESQDLYDVYLGGAKQGTMVITNPYGTPGKELVIFRDSYGSSIAPLLVSDYAKVTLIDIRQYSPAFPNPFLKCQNADVLFLYSTLVLNNSIELK